MPPDPPVVSVDGTITWRASGLTDSAVATKRVNCVETNIPHGGVTYEWTLTLPSGYPAPLPPLTGTGATVNVVAKVAGVYSCSFVAKPTRTDCPPADLQIAPATAQAPDVTSVEWVTHPGNTALDGCPNNGGKRILPDKISALDGAAAERPKVDLVVNISPIKEGCNVHLKVWDVDDPFDQNNPGLPGVTLIDGDTNGADNRGTAGGLSQGSAATDANGKAVTTFSVSMQPGDNFRAAASVVQTAIDGTTQTQADTNSPPQYVKFTDMLTVWRRLHVETDTMLRPTFAQNTYVMPWGYPVAGATPDRVQLQVSDPVFEFDTGEGQFENGLIELRGTAGVVVGRIIEYHSTSGWDEVVVVITSANGLGGHQGLAGLGGMTEGTGTLSDDDLGDEPTFKGRVWGCDDGYASGGALGPPDVSAVGTRYEPAYIVPVHATEVSAAGGLTTFLVNADFGFPSYGVALWDQAKSPTVRQLPISTPNFWTVMVVSGWQAETGKDGDPNTEQLTNGIGTHSTDGSTTAIWQLGSAYTGVCAIFKALMAGESDIPERFTVAHEIAHTLGLPHSATGLMFAAESVNAAAQQTQPFSADSLKRLREYVGP